MNKIRKWITCCLAATIAAAAYAEDIVVKHVRYAGPFRVDQPLFIDTVDVRSQAFKPESLLDVPLKTDLAERGKIVSTLPVASGEAPYTLHLLQFNVQVGTYHKLGIEVKGLKHYQVYVNGKKQEQKEVGLTPQFHRVVIKYLSQQGHTDTLAIKLTNADSTITVNTDIMRPLTLTDIQNGHQYSNLALSADGRYLITTCYDVFNEGQVRYWWRLSELRTGRILRESPQEMKWLPGTNQYYVIRNAEGGRELVSTDLQTGKETILAHGIGEGSITVAPNADYLILATSSEPPKEDDAVHQIIEPDDRQPGWRTRWNLSLYDLKTGLSSPLTFGYHNVSLLDISNDGRYILFMVSRRRLEKRPTTLSSLYRMNVKTRQCEEIVKDEGFISSAVFSPDARQLLVKASPEAFSGVGKNVPEGRIPSIYDYQLFVVNIADKAVKPLTRNFNPSVEYFRWNPSDGKIYFTALDKDKQQLFRLDPVTGRFTRFSVPEDCVTRIRFADKAPMAAWYGESTSNSDRLYSLQLSNGKSTLIEDLSTLKLKDVTLGTCQSWNFVSSRGDTLSGRCYLPPHFDAAKKYPLIVYYYGGCSPVSSFFEGHYPLHLYAAQGYVVYIINPSGAAGFGQEFSSRHVNTAGKGVADDIIEGTKAFLAAHPYVDAKRIGCIGASYGGFMTQYLQTQTDIFAAAVSHAGISDHTSYWGEGYWGYSYSEVSMAESYPWNRKDLYVDQSPLFNADKIHTPLLFLHGSADTNVPIGESIQMFTALKLLGRPTAFVVVDGENHGISNYQKRVKWQNTIFAWFAKYLKNDNGWWQALYPDKSL